MKTITTICAECGSEFQKRKSDYTRSEKNNLRHFCSRSCSVTKGNKEMSLHRRKKCGEQIKKFAGNRQDKNSPFKYFINKTNCKDRIQRYGQSNLTIEYLKELWTAQKGICPYTNLTMVLPKNTLEYHKKGCPLRASLDRINSSMGYVKGNVEFVCYSVNVAKNGFTRDQMMEFFGQIKSAGVPGANKVVDLREFCPPGL